MADKTNVVITIENGAVSIAVLQDETPTMCFSGFESSCEAPVFKSFFSEEEEVCFRFADDEPGCDPFLPDVLEAMFLDEVLDSLDEDEPMMPSPHPRVHYRPSPSGRFCTPTAVSLRHGVPSPGRNGMSFVF